MLESHGFAVEYAEIIKRPVILPGASGLKGWIEENAQKSFEGMAEERKRDVIFGVTIDCLHAMDGEEWRPEGVYLRVKARSKSPSLTNTFEQIRSACPGFPWDIIYGEDE